MLSRLNTVLKKIHFPAWSFPLALLAVCFLAFGLLANRTGFYWDDWPPILVHRFQGIERFWRYFSFDRPLSAWTYILFTPLLGESPLPWHIFSLLLRWLTALGMWWTLCALWPGRSRQAAFASLLFAVYPAFLQQPLAVTYHQLWLQFAFFFISMGAMLRAARAQRGSLAFWLYTALSLATLALNFSISEYLIGLEALRPLLLWVALSSDSTATRSQRLRKTVLLWLPFLLISIAYVVWRLFLIRLSQDDPNRPNELYAFLSQPMATIPQLIRIMLQDGVFILVSNWYKTFSHTLFESVQPFTFLSLAIGLAAGVGAGFFLLKQDGGEAGEQNSGKWGKQALALGMAALVLGPLPAWAIGRQAIGPNFADRYAVAAMFGASLVIVALIEWIAQQRLQKTVLLCVLLGLAVSFQVRNENEYRWLWVKQTRFYWQLAWRAPQIQFPTAILVEDEIFPQQALFSTSAAINLIYPPAPEKRLTTWLFRLNPNYRDNIEQLFRGEQFVKGHRTLFFSGATPDTFVLYYDPNKTNCVWVLRPEDRDNPEIPDLTRQALRVSNLERISPQGAPGYPPQHIFGKEPPHGWCYLFEKADLARQMGDWQQVVALAGEAQNQGYHPTQSESDNPHEWIPFIEGYAHTGDWGEAQRLTLEASSGRYKQYIPRLCRLWGQLQASTPPSPERDQAIRQVGRGLGCR